MSTTNANDTITDTASHEWILKLKIPPEIFDMRTWNPKIRALILLTWRDMIVRSRK